MLRHLPRSSPADLSRAAVLPTVIFSLLLSIYLFRSSPISFSFSLSIRFAAASVSAPRRAAPRRRQHGPAASLSLIRALVPLRHSSCSFRVLCPSPSIRLAIVSLSHHPATTCFSREEPRFSRDRRDDIRMRAPSLPISYNSSLFRPAVFYVDFGIPFRSTMLRFSRKITTLSVSLNSYSRDT